MEVSGRKALQLFCEPCGDNGQKFLAAGFVLTALNFCVKCVMNITVEQELTGRMCFKTENLCQKQNQIMCNLK